MKFSNTVRNIFSILFVLFIILASFVLPAAADDEPSLTSTLNSSDSNNPEKLAPNQTKKVTYTLDFPLGSDLGAGTDPEQDPLPYAFNITISNPNSTFGPLSDLILIEDAAKFDAEEFKINSTISPVIGSDNIVYYFDELPARGSISFQLSIPGPAVYPNETATITATLSQIDVNGDEGLPIVNCTNEIIVDYSLSSTNLVSLADFSLTRPLLLPVGVANESIFVLANSFLRYSENMTGPNSIYSYYSYVVDFSDVDITIDGNTKTYSQWISAAASAGEAPVYFVPLPSGNDGSDLTSLDIAQFSASVLNNTSLTLLSAHEYDSSYKYDSNNVSFPFLIIINENFTKGVNNYPSIDLRNVSIDVELMVNGKGKEEVLGFYSNGTTPSDSVFSIEGPNLTWSGGHSLNLSVYSYNTKINPVGDGTVDVGHLLTNSSNILDDRFKYQELLTVGLTNAVPGDVTIKVEVDNNVTLTHLRIPGPNTDYSKYSSVTITNESGDEVTYNAVTSGRNATLLNLTNLPDISFGQGENITLMFSDLEYLKSQEGGPLNFSDANLIDFVGQTHGDTASSVTFKVIAAYDTTRFGADKSYYDFDEGYSTDSTISYTLVDDYSITVLNSGIRFSGDGISNNIVNEWDYPFYMSMDIAPSNYPYLGAYRNDPLNPFNTISLPNPAVYFIVPDDLKYIQGSATLVGGPSVGIAMNETIVTTTGGQEIVVIQIGNETVPGNGIFNPSVKYLLNDSVTVKFAVSVSDTFNDSTLTVPPYTLLGGSWDPDAVGLSGVWNTYTISLRNANIDPSDQLTVAGLNLVPYGTYYGAPTLTSPDDCMSKNVKVSAKNATSMDFTHNPNRAVSANVPEFGANSDGAFTLQLKSKDVAPSNATALFILPKGSFTPALTGLSFRDDSFIPVISNFSLQYTTQAATPGNVVYSDTIGWDWKSATYNSGTKKFTLQGGDDFSQITAVKLNVTAYQGVLNLSMPFDVSNLSDPSPSAWNNGVIIGQTLYEFDDSGPVNKGYTTAIKYVPTVAPTVMWKNSAGDGPTSNPASPSPSGLGNSFNYNNSSNDDLPKWNEIFISNDDGWLDLKSVKVTFLPSSGPSEDLISMADLSPSGTTGTYQSNFTIDDSASKVNLKRVGKYTVTFVTAPDIDNRTATATYTFNVVKGIDTITFESHVNPDDEVEFFMGDHADIFDDLSDLSWLYDPADGKIGTDSNGGHPIDLMPTHFVLESDPSRSADFFKTPGSYPLKYVYSDSADFGNSIPINVTMIVKYTGTLTIDAKLVTENITDFSDSIVVNVAVDGGTEIPAMLSGDQYVFTLRANSTTPTSTSYAITVDRSTLPVGLKMPASISNASGVGQGLTLNPTETINFEAVSIEALIAGESDQVNSVKLYGGSSDTGFVSDFISGSPDSYTFNSDSWFNDVEYYVLISLNPGYEVVISPQIPDIVSPNSILEANTVGFHLNHSDVVYTFTVQKSTLISGVLWGDIDGNSTNDDAVFISGATVKLLSSDGITELGSTQTDGGGRYYLTKDNGLDEGDDYYVQIQPPAGYNRASPYGSDQMIHSDDEFKSDLISIGTAGAGGTGILHHEVGGGFYYQSSGGSRFNSATIVDNSNNGQFDNGSASDNGNASGSGNTSGSGNQSDNGNGSNSGNVTGNNGSKSELGDESGAGKRFTILGLIVLILSIIVGLIQLFVTGNKRAKKLVDIHRTLRMIVAVLMVVVAVIFLLTYDFTGKMILYDWIDLVLAAIFIGQLILISRIFKNRNPEQ